MEVSNNTCSQNATDRSTQCLVLGLGNCLLQDDGIGVHAARALMADPPEGVVVLEVGTDAFSAVPWLESAPQVLAIDAMDAGGQPGDVFQFDSQDVKAQAPQHSLHEMGLLAILEFVPREKWPAITVLGVQPKVIGYGLELSPPLQEALPKVVETARKICALPR